MVGRDLLKYSRSNKVNGVVKGKYLLTFIVQKVKENAKSKEGEGIQARG